MNKMNFCQGFYRDEQWLFVNFYNAFIEQEVGSADCFLDDGHAKVIHFYQQEYHPARKKSISKSDFDKGFALFEKYLRCVFHFMIHKSIHSYLCHFRAKSAKSGMNPILNIFFFFRCPHRQYILRLSRRWSKQSRVSTCGTGTWTSNIIMQTRITNTEIKNRIWEICQKTPLGSPLP